MRYRPGWILFTLQILFALACKAQTPVDTLEHKVKASLTNYYKKYPQEKVFVHTSQNVYAGGQTLWYKVYATAYGKPSAISKIVYIQLVDGSGKVLIQNKQPLTNGQAYGNMDLSDSLHTGWYQLKSFTSWMINFGEGGYYHQNIYIQNTADTIRRPGTNLSKKYNISFYPEGGDMIDGSLCSIAFKAVDDAGLPANIYGEVQDKNNQPIAKLMTVHDGMGSFSLEPSANSTYKAIVHFPDKTTQTVQLPGVKKEGISLQVNPAGETEMQIEISYSGSSAKYSNALMVAFQNNGRIASYPLQLDRGINEFSIQKKDFATGILRLTIFDKTGMPEAERLVFIDKRDQLNLKLIANTLSGQPHAKQVFSLSASGADGKPVSGNFSIAITDAEAGINDDANDNICSSFLVTSELRGYIHHPSWYFKNNSDSLRQQLDLVMLTNGWRHFKWDEILNNTPVKLHHPVETQQYIAGRILNYVKPVSLKDQFTIKLLILNQDSSKFIGYVTPDSTGRFILDDYNHRGLSTLFMETTDRKNRVKKLKINLSGTLADSLKYIPALGFDLIDKQPPASLYLLKNGIAEKNDRLMARGILLKSVAINQKKLSPTQEIINDHVSPLYTSLHEYTLDFVNNPMLDIGFINYIRGRFPGLHIDASGNFYYLSNNTLQGSTSAPAKSTAGSMDPTNPPAPMSVPYFFLNEAPVQLIDVEDIPMQDIALIRFMPPPVVFAPYNGGNVGAILVYTKNNKDDRATLTSREEFNQYTFNGYSITREFSSPDYSFNKTAPLPDTRTMLYWNHDVNVNGSMQFHFYNSDKAKKYRVTIEGMDRDGRLGYLSQQTSPL